MPISSYPNIISSADRIVSSETNIVATDNVRKYDTESVKMLAEIMRYGNTYPRQGSDSTSTHAYYLEGRWTPRSNFPISNGPMYTTIDPRDIKPWMHTMGAYLTGALSAHYNGNAEYMYPRDAHITSKTNFDPIPDEIYPIESVVPGVENTTPFAKWNLQFRQSNVFQFRGSVTPVNPENDPEKKYILENGLENNVHFLGFSRCAGHSRTEVPDQCSGGLLRSVHEKSQ